MSRQLDARRASLTWLWVIAGAYVGLMLARPSGSIGVVFSVAAAALSALGYKQTRAPRAGAGLSWQRAVLFVVGGYVVLAAGRWTIGVVTTWAWPGFQSEGQTHHVLRVLDVRALVVVAVAAPIIEECLFRGILFDLASRRSTIAGVVVTSFLFAAVHWWVLADAGVIAPAVWLGAVLGALRSISGGIGLPVALHVLNNVISEFIGLA